MSADNDQDEEELLVPPFTFNTWLDVPSLAQIPSQDWEFASQLEDQAEATRSSDGLFMENLWTINFNGRKIMCLKMRTFKNKAKNVLTKTTFLSQNLDASLNAHDTNKE